MIACVRGGGDGSSGTVVMMVVTERLVGTRAESGCGLHFCVFFVQGIFVFSVSAIVLLGYVSIN